MDDLIYRYELLKKVTKYCCESCDLDEVVVYPCEGCLVMDAATKIKESPTIDAEPVRHGLWKYVKKPLARGGYVDASECSVCHKIIFPYVNMNYCPYCGAKMEVDCSE